MTDKNIVHVAVNTIRTLSMDAVQQAKSGHPGTPMSMAPVAAATSRRSSGATKSARGRPAPRPSSGRDRR